MDSFIMEIVGFSFEVKPIFESTVFYCRDYWSDREPEYRIEVCRADLNEEQQLLNLEADEDGLKRRKFPEPFLERSAIQRKVAEKLLEQNVILMHGSTVAVDGQAFLFTAPCGTGKSTHTRLWREIFGERAVMVNDDKPFLRFRDGGIFAYGSPWSGKHGLASNVCFPLAGVCVLRRGAENVIRRIDGSDISEFLLHQIQPGGNERISALLEEMLARVPLWEMACNRDTEAARISYSAMSGKGL